MLSLDSTTPIPQARPAYTPHPFANIPKPPSPPIPRLSPFGPPPPPIPRLSPSGSPPPPPSLSSVDSSSSVRSPYLGILVVFLWALYFDRERWSKIENGGRERKSFGE